MPPHVDQNAIALRLAREARTRGAERYALMPLPRVFEQGPAGAALDGLDSFTVAAWIWRRSRRR